MDTASYTRARWNDLVRTLVALGLQPQAAERVAADTLVRCHRDWKRESRDGDVDVLVFATLLGELPVIEGAARVLTAGAGLSAYQAEQVLGEYVDELGAVAFGEEWQDLYRGSAPVDAIQARVRADRRRRARLTAVGLAALTVAVAVSLLVSGGDGTSPQPRPEPTSGPAPPAARNPIGLAWFSQDAVQLAANTVPVAGLATLTQAGPASSYVVVYGQGNGDVVQVTAGATSSTIGQVEPGTPIVGSVGGLVAWVDPGRGRPRLVVWDTATSRRVGSLPLADPRARPIAIDGDAVYVHTRAGDLRWRRGDAGGTRVPGGLLDVAGGVDLRAATGAPAGVAPLADGSFTVSGVDAALSAAGDVVASWTDGSSGVTLTRRALSAPAPTSLDLAAGDQVLDARFAPDDSLVVLAVAAGSPDLFTCHTDDGTCVLAAALGAEASPITLAH